jgi:hypothetical protein
VTLTISDPRIKSRDSRSGLPRRQRDCDIRIHAPPDSRELQALDAEIPIGILRRSGAGPPPRRCRQAGLTISITRTPGWGNQELCLTMRDRLLMFSHPAVRVRQHRQESGRRNSPAPCAFASHARLSRPHSTPPTPVTAWRFAPHGDARRRTQRAVRIRMRMSHVQQNAQAHLRNGRSPSARGRRGSSPAQARAASSGFAESAPARRGPPTPPGSTESA